jgi:hypothetical protein
MSMDQETCRLCISIAEDVKLEAEKAAVGMSYGELYGEHCKIEAAQEIIDRIRAALDATSHG